MHLLDTLILENIDIEQLQNQLKLIGVNLSSFENIQQEQIPTLIDLLKNIIVTDFSTSNQITKFKAKEFRGKLEKVLKGQRINIIPKETTETKVP